MTVEAFLDTNVLVYAATGSGKDQPKRDKAQKLISSLDFGTSAQVLQEFYVTTVKKAARPLSAADALQWIEQLSELPCQPVDHRLVRIAIEYSGRYRLSYWDAAIVASAEALGARTLYSEDLNHGQFFGRLQVVNPFL
jgi:predicted nucleic acid-binding protein